jgi:multimeric flavodoxin WrbA
VEDIKIKVLGLSATVIKDGNCDTMVKSALESARELGGVQTEFITLADKKIEMCQHCQYCIKNRCKCKIEDDAGMVLEAMGNADGIIFGAPTWNRNVIPLLGNLFSRVRYMGFFDPLIFRNKVAGYCTIGFLGFGMENALHIMEEYTYGLGMIPAARSTASSSTVVRGERAGYLENGVLDDERGMLYVKIVGLRVVELAKMVKLASMSGAIPGTPYNISTGARIGERERVFKDGVWRDHLD